MLYLSLGQISDYEKGIGESEDRGNTKRQNKSEIIQIHPYILYISTSSLQTKPIHRNSKKLKL